MFDYKSFWSSLFYSFVFIQILPSFYLLLFFDNRGRFYSSVPIGENLQLIRNFYIFCRITNIITESKPRTLQFEFLPSIKEPIIMLDPESFWIELVNFLIYWIPNRRMLIFEKGLSLELYDFEIKKSWTVGIWKSRMSIALKSL